MNNFSTLKLLGDILPDPAKGRGDTPASAFDLFVMFKTAKTVLVRRGS